ncbi:hypothetical protein [Helicobacter zhangjianzhongii]|uniref:Uncharacterized protein n=1 Tax=Helicobacter zhangjianzhongii TaxID=2974574 RepID=A0ACC6FR28_9HELI|nr:hypothetical protein [Helicobacter sp. CPD2-1]MDL0079409.1 hypothetical protein [Helicobacter sp. CPD2-1]MDL0081690.1 hypothetical protein [Helicobacter sp. XJK30-2]
MDSAFACFSKETALRLFWWILRRRGLAHYRLGKSLRPRLENPQNHRKILESFMSFLPRETLGKTPSRHCEGAKRPKQSTKKWILALRL